MPESPLILRYAARSHVGLVRSKNDDSAYAGRYLAVVADGMGGHAGGDVASASTVLDLVHLDHDNYADDAGTHLADEIQTANSLLSELVHVNPKLAGMGTTVTSLLLSGQRLAYAHIGDSRAYRLKDGVFEQMSTDHTFVQRMIDEGRMTEAEAEVHPHKNVLMRVLGDVDASPELDLKYFDAAPGERWLLCSDGLNFVRPAMIEEVVRNTHSLATAAETLIDLTLAAGSPDNVTVVLVDVVERTAEDTDDGGTPGSAATSPLSLPGEEDGLADQALAAGPAPSRPLTATTDSDDLTDEDLNDGGTAGGGSDGAGQERADGTGTESTGTEAASVETAGTDANASSASTPADSTQPGGAQSGSGEDLDAHIRATVVRHELAMRPHELVGAAVTANAEGKIPLLERHPATQRAATLLTHRPVDAPVSDLADAPLRRSPYRRAILIGVGVLVAAALITGGWLALAWTQTQYFVGAVNGNVAIFQGVSQNLGPISLSHLDRETGIPVSSLPEYSQQLVAQTLPASSLAAAEQIISDLQLGTGSGTPPCGVLETPTPFGHPYTTGAATAQPSASPAQSGKTAPSGKPVPTAKPGSTAPAKTVPSAKAGATAGATASATPSATSGPSPTPTCIPGGGR